MALIQGVLLCSTVVVPGPPDSPQQDIELCLDRLVWGGLTVTVVTERDAALQGHFLSNRSGIQCLCAQQLKAAQPRGLHVAVVTELTPGAVLEAFQVHGTLLWSCKIIEPSACHPALAHISNVSGVIPGISRLPQHIAYWQAAHAQPPGSVHVVGHVMKPSRERDMAQCTSTGRASIAADGDGDGDSSSTRPPARPGLLALVPQQGLVFAPLDLGAPLDDQLPLDLVLHKASDELEYGEDGLPRFSARMRRLQQWLAAHPSIRVIDNFEATATVINRIELCRRASGVRELPPQAVQVPASCTLHHQSHPTPLTCIFTTPSYCVLHGLQAAAVRQAVLDAGIKPPYLVKPAVACGLHDSHRMLLAASLTSLQAALQDPAAVQLPLPLIVQEFVNHGGKLAKVYVAGNKVFTAYRSSIPDLQLSSLHPSSGSTHEGMEANQYQLTQPGFLFFDSLKSLPTSLPCSPVDAESEPAQASATFHHPQQPVDLEGLLTINPSLINNLADALRTSFSLTLFGFDVIAAPHTPGQGSSVASTAAVEQGAARGVALHVIDVNFFPSYRMAGAATFIREALKATL